MIRGPETPDFEREETPENKNGGNLPENLPASKDEDYPEVNLSEKDEEELKRSLRQILEEHKEGGAGKDLSA